MSATALLPEPLGFIGTCDLSGHFRGKGFPMADLAGRMRSGFGLAPTNIMMSAFGPIHGTPFGTTGELVLKPVAECGALVPMGIAGTDVTLFPADLVTQEGTPWVCCPRGFLTRGLAALEAAAGLRAYATFEQEFVHTGIAERPGMPYRFDAFVEAGGFGGTLVAALRRAGLTPDSFLAENGPSQFEVTIAPKIGARAADEAVIARELTRAVAAAQGHRAIHAPMLSPDGATSGTHIHISLLDADGLAVMHDPARRLGLSHVGEAFVAGIVAHLPALVALTAPSVVSYYRLRPGKWAPTQADVGVFDRGRAIRLCASKADDPEAERRRYNMEFRVCDATASPYLALGALIHAGADGIARGLSLDPAAPSPALPASLGEALDLLEASDAVRRFLGAELVGAYAMLKRSEIAALDGLTDQEICDRYAAAY